GQAATQRQRVASLEQAARAAAEALTGLRADLAAAKGEHLEQMRAAARLQNDAVSYKAQLDNLRRERDRLRLKSAQAAESLASRDVELEELTGAEAALQSKLQAARQALADLRRERDSVQLLRDDTSELLSRLRQVRSGLASRVEVLEGLERSQEGLG